MVLILYVKRQLAFDRKFLEMLGDNRSKAIMMAHYQNLDKCS